MVIDYDRRSHGGNLESFDLLVVRLLSFRLTDYDYFSYRVVAVPGKSYKINTKNIVTLPLSVILK